MIILREPKNYGINFKETYKPIAFILGNYLTAGLGVARGLGNKGIPVIWLNSKRKHIGFASRYCTGIVSPHPKNSMEKYIDLLLEF